jgi:protein TonB
VDQVTDSSFARWVGWSAAAHLALGIAIWIASPRMNPPGLVGADAAVTIVSLVDAPSLTPATRPASATPVSSSRSARVQPSMRSTPDRTVEPALTGDTDVAPAPAPAFTSFSPTPFPSTSRDEAQPDGQPLAREIPRDHPEFLAPVGPAVTERHAMGGTLGEAYRPLVLSILEHAKRYPLLAQRRGLEGTVEIAFMIHADGRLSDPELIASSTHHVLDDAALAIVRRIGSVPPPPDRNSVRFPARIQYRLDP